MQRSGQLQQVVLLDLQQRHQLLIGCGCSQPPVAPGPGDQCDHNGHQSRSNGSQAMASIHLAGRPSLSRACKAKQAASRVGRLV